IVPELSHASPIDGFNAMLLGALVVVAPDASVSMSWESSTSKPLLLRTETVAPGDSDAFAFWPVGEQGHYELTVRDLVPPMVGAPADVCRIADTATVGFTVGSVRERSRTLATPSRTRNGSGRADVLAVDRGGGRTMTLRIRDRA